jgi:hypothetical protein
VIAKRLGSLLDSDDFAIQVSEWETFSFQGDVEQPNGERSSEKGYYFHTPSFPADKPQVIKDQVADDDQTKGVASNEAKEIQTLTSNRNILNRSKSNASAVESVHEDPCLKCRDLWETDEECHHLAREGFYQTPTAKDGTTIVTVEEGCQLSTNRSRTNSSSHVHNQPQYADASHYPSRRHRRTHTFDASLLDSYNFETETIKNRLHGYVRP